jgi:hypothetical protein
MSETAERQTYTCTRCNGTGRYSFNLLHGTTCFGCKGTGKQKTRPAKPSPKWAVFGQHRQTGEWLRLYNVVAKSKTAAINKAQLLWTNGSTDWKNTYTLATARAMKWTDMASVEALTWKEALKPGSKEKA